MTSADCNIWLWTQARAAAEEWNRLQCANVFANLHLYFKRGSIRVSEGLPAGDYELGSGTRIGPAGTPDQVTQWIYDTARRLPCLPEE